MHGFRCPELQCDFHPPLSPLCLSPDRPKDLLVNRFVLSKLYLYKEVVAPGAACRTGATPESRRTFRAPERAYDAASSQAARSKGKNCRVQPFHAGLPSILPGRIVRQRGAGCLATGTSSHVPSPDNFDIANRLKLHTFAARYRPLDRQSTICISTNAAISIFLCNPILGPGSKNGLLTCNTLNSQKFEICEFFFMIEYFFFLMISKKKRGNIISNYCPNYDCDFYKFCSLQPIIPGKSTESGQPDFGQETQRNVNIFKRKYYNLEIPKQY